MRRIAIFASIALSLCGSQAWAAGGYIYLVNGTGGRLQFVVDAQTFPPMDHLMALSIRKINDKPIILAGEPKPTTEPLLATGASLSPDLSAASAVLDAKGRSFWCFIAGKQADGAFRIIATDQPTCGELIKRGVGDRPLK